MTFDELDPEVIADLRKRAATEHDSTRSRGEGVYEWQRPVIAAHWPCRGKCGAKVPVDDSAVHAFDVNNAKLRSEGKPEILTGDVAFCPECKARGAPVRAEQNRQRHDELARLIRELKALVDNDLRERSLLAQIRALGHPDVDGLQRAAAASRAARTSKRKQGI